LEKPTDTTGSAGMSIYLVDTNQKNHSICFPNIITHL